MEKKASKIKGIASPGQVKEEKKDIVSAEGTKKRLPGRPPGAKNKDTVFKELMTGKFQDVAAAKVEKVINVLFEKANDGDMKAIKLIMDRVVPVTKAVDLADMEKKGLTVNITVGDMMQAQTKGEMIEDAEYSLVEEA